METFGMKLRRIRYTNGWSQEEFARRIGSSKQVISRYELDIRSPKVSTVYSFAKALSVPVSELFPDDEPFPPGADAPKLYPELVIDDDMRAINRAWRKMSPTRKARTIRILEASLGIDLEKNSKSSE